MTLFNISIANNKTIGHIPGFQAKIMEKDARNPNRFSVIIEKGNNILIGDEINFFNLENDYTFGGIVQRPIDSTGIQTLDVSDYGIALSQTSVSEVFENINYSDIIEFLIDTYTDFTFVNNLSFNPPTTTKLIRRDAWLIDIINELLPAFNGGFTVDKNKVFTLFQLNDSVNPNSLVNGIDSLNKPWETDNNLRAERVIVKGAVIDQRTQETLIGTGTEFFTARVPDNVEIIGFTQTTENIIGDYLVDKTNKKITFDNSQTNPVINYTYQSQIRVELGEGKTVRLEKKYIESKSEARSLAREYQSRFIDGAQSSRWLKATSDIEAYNVGDGISVTDNINGFSGLYTIIELALEYPDKLLITVGEEEADMFDWQKEAIDRIKQLEQKENNSDFITIDEYIISGLKIKITKEFTELKSIINDGTILWASETPLATDADLISDVGPDIDFALAYDDVAIPSNLIIDYLTL